MKNKKKFDYSYLIYSLLLLALIGVVIYGGNEGWFKNYTNIYNSEKPDYIKPISTEESLTCQQQASKLNLIYYTELFSDAKECLNYANIDCQENGKILEGYGLNVNCCYYSCVEIQQPEVQCEDTDDGLSYAIFGTCSDSDTPYIEDYCLGGALQEQVCENNQCAEKQYFCPNGRVCDFGKCISV